MSDEKILLDEIVRLQDIDYVKGLDPILGTEYCEMTKGDYGDDIIKTGEAMLGYFFDLFKKDLKLGIEAIKVIFCGYPGLPYTDLYGPMYDSVSTRRLWYYATEKLDMDNRLVQSLILNTYFRWYTTTYELFRKMLIFDCYCHGQTIGHPINVKNYLFTPKDPSKNLDSSGSKEREALIAFYNSTIRHSISHGNVIIIPNHFVVIRQTDEEKQKVIEKIYDNPEKFISEVTPDIEIMYGAIRFFNYIICNYLITRYTDLFKKYIGNLFTDKVLIAMVKSIQSNPENPVY